MIIFIKGWKQDDLEIFHQMYGIAKFASIPTTAEISWEEAEEPLCLVESPSSTSSSSLIPY